MAEGSTKMSTRGKAVFVAQQLHFANTLAGNSPKHRARAMNKLKQYLLARSSGNFCFAEDDFMRIWKGLFYCMWMSDKPLIQEELAEQISSLVHCFSATKLGLLFIKSFFSTIMAEWFGIDFHRMDKFQMFVRRFLRQSFEYCKNQKWAIEVVEGLADVFGCTVLSPHIRENDCSDVGLTMHFIDIFIEELAKVGMDKLPENIILEFLKPFAANLVEQEDIRVQKVIEDRIFFCLIRESPQGMEYEEKFKAWKRAGFPGTTWKNMVFVGKIKRNAGCGVQTGQLDPRAGGVNVYLRHLEFDAGKVAEMLKEYAEKSSKIRCKKFILKIALKFQALSKDKYPLAIGLSKTLEKSRKYKFSKHDIEEAVDNYVKYEEDEKKAIRLEKRRKRKQSDSESSTNARKKIKLSTSESDLLQEIESHGEQSEESISEDNKITKSKTLTKIRMKKKRAQNQSSWDVSEITHSQSELCKMKGEAEENEKENFPEGTLNTNSEEELDHAAESCARQIASKTSEEKVMTEEGHRASEATLTLPNGKNKRVIATPLRRSIRKLNKVPQSSPVVSEDKMEASTSQDVIGSVKEDPQTPLPQDYQQQELNEMSPDTGVVGEEEQGDKTCQPDVCAAVTALKRKSLTPVAEMPMRRRSSKVPERDLPLQQQNKKEIQESGEHHVLSPEPKTGLKVSTFHESCSEEVNDSSSSSSGSGKNSVLSVSQSMSPRVLLKRTPMKRLSLRTSTPSSNKKVNIMLQMNRSQGVSEYVAAVKQSPSVPHDANKKPSKGVLKQSLQSPINPFYVRPKV